MCILRNKLENAIVCELLHSTEIAYRQMSSELCFQIICSLTGMHLYQLKTFNLYKVHVAKGFGPQSGTESIVEFCSWVAIHEETRALRSDCVQEAANLLRCEVGYCPSMKCFQSRPEMIQITSESVTKEE